VSGERRAAIDPRPLQLERSGRRRAAPAARAQGEAAVVPPLSCALPGGRSACGERVPAASGRQHAACAAGRSAACRRHFLPPRRALSSCFFPPGAFILRPCPVLEHLARFATAPPDQPPRAETSQMACLKDPAKGYMDMEMAGARDGGAQGMLGHGGATNGGGGGASGGGRRVCGVSPGTLMGALGLLLGAVSLVIASVAVARPVRGGAGGGGMARRRARAPAGPGAGGGRRAAAASHATRRVAAAWGQPRRQRLATHPTPPRPRPPRAPPARRPARSCGARRAAGRPGLTTPAPPLPAAATTRRSRP
jgi:hypothetical protein